MRFRRIALAALAALWVPTMGVGLAFCDVARGTVPSETGAATDQARTVVERGIHFLEVDAVKWKAERGCATCHHGMLTVWALSEAKAQGYPVNELALADFIAWAKNGSVPPLDQPRDPRPGWRLVSQRAVYLGMMSHNLPILSRDELHRVSVHLARHQEPDGAYELPPPANGPPPVFFESREVVALFAVLAWEPYVSADPEETAANRASREKTEAWLSTNPSTETTQAVALRLLVEVRAGRPDTRLKPSIERLLKCQNSDGGWSQEKGLTSDAYATGQALYALSFAGLKRDRPEIQRAIRFLVSTQREDGSWPVTPRNYPGVDWKRTGLAMNYFGSSWAVLGLARYVPSPPDTAAKQRDALDMIRGYHGKYAVDETKPDRPVVRVDLRFYDELDDGAVARLVEALQAFPQLTTLQLKSTRITDAGLAHLKNLPHLRSLTVENAPITDAGLAHLKALTRLEALTLAGTKVTDAGLQSFQLAAPRVKVER
jgi:hypothetical protein